MGDLFLLSLILQSETKRKINLLELICLLGICLIISFQQVIWQNLACVCTLFEKTYLTVLSIKTLQWLDILKGSTIWQRRDFNFSKLWKCSRCICYHDNTTEKAIVNGANYIHINEGKVNKTEKGKIFKGQMSKEQGLFILVFCKQNLATSQHKRIQEILL